MNRFSQLFSVTDCFGTQTVMKAPSYENLTETFTLQTYERRASAVL